MRALPHLCGGVRQITAGISANLEAPRQWEHIWVLEPTRMVVETILFYITGTFWITV